MKHAARLPHLWRENGGRVPPYVVNQRPKLLHAPPTQQRAAATSSLSHHAEIGSNQRGRAHAHTHTHTHTPVRACLGTADRGCKPARGHGVQPRGTVPPWSLVDHHATGEDASPFTSLPWSRCTCCATFSSRGCVTNHACVLFVMIDERTTAGPAKPSAWCTHRCVGGPAIAWRCGCSERGCESIRA